MADDEIDHWHVSRQRPAHHGPRQQVLHIVGNQCKPPRRGHQRHHHCRVVHTLRGRQRHAFALQIVLHNRTQHPSLVGHPHKGLPHQLLRPDALLRGQCMVARHQHDQGLAPDRCVVQIKARLGAQKSQVEPASRQGIRQVW